MESGDDLRTIHRTNKPLEAEMIRDFLGSHGVPAMARGTAMPAGIQDFYAVDLTRAEVCVYQRDWDRAMQVLSDNREDVKAILATSLPEPGLSMFRLRNIGSSGKGAGEGLRASAMLLYLPFRLLGRFVDWLAYSLVKKTGPRN